MITVLYPSDDFDAANVAVKVQALAQSRNQRVYVVPKHFGRNKTDIQKNLKNSTVVLFIAQSAETIDNGTIEELKFLQSINKKIVGFIPFDLELPSSVEQHFSSLERYHRGNSSDLRNIVLSYLTKVQKNQDSGGFLIVLGLILFLFLLAFNSDD